MSQNITLGKALKLAAVQAAPIFLNRTATTQKVADLIRLAGTQGADVIGFPEGFIPGYPGWHALLSDGDPLTTSLYLQLFDQAVEVPGPEIDRLQEACREANVTAVIGVNERPPNTTGTLYNTQVFIGSDGTLLHKHQKLVPTVGERLIHASGTTGSKASVQADFGGLSGLVCAENGNPLSQYSVGLGYPVVHVASWPQFLTYGMDVNDLIQVAGKAVANAVGTYVINAASVVDDAEIELYGTDEKIRTFMREERQRRRASIFGPGGVEVARARNGSNEEILYAEVDAGAVRAFKHIFDFAGHYQRPEVFATLFEQYLSGTK
ncbi:carbon-nitrogen hydrolase [Aaosphaeria arxii CBS 175.79]|uniref:Carbon-nitrogen hydrolase n=1 Tax=Aaosphaeria arxii CBS 175.79 TaxID=1450172 RepID=A0A6A5XJC9_9PLEO|nr:carbon-nitrogen hydrolase [Aaosphaeria arxii CBS 175.79]KAF2012976.1 carbon-nitrogen hydrolase [Aaosphaeria arxii CBS 175.79]